MIPTHLKDYVTETEQNDTEFDAVLCDSKGGKLFEIWYYGIFNDDIGCICSTDETGSRIVAKSVDTGEEILVYDAILHGYDNMFCINHEKNVERPLIKLDIPPAEILIECSYGIDYDEEKDTYDFDENGRCILIDGTSVPWEQVKSDGIDWINLSYSTDNGKSYVNFVSDELA